MAKTTIPTFASTGKQTDTINVLLSYRIVELFSEGLYSSPNKAIDVPIPPLESQRWFNRLQEKAWQARAAAAQILADSDLTMPAILDRAFKGEL